MSEQIQIPDYLKGIVDETAKDMISVGGSVPRISIKGRQFRFIKDGEEVHKQTEPIHVVILGVVPQAHMAKTFYASGYQPGSTDPPDCSSFLGEVPDTWIDNPQNPSCKGCPQNVWGSATSMSGGKAKACKDSKRLMVVTAKDLVEGEEEPTVYIFNVTIASLKALTEYGKFLMSNSLPMSAVITQIEFVDSEFPQVELKFLSVLAENHGLLMMEKAKRAEWMDGYTQEQLSAPDNAPAKQIEQQATLQQQTPPQQQAPPQSTPPGTGLPPDNAATEVQSTSELLEKW